VPPREIRELRDLTHYHKALIRERASEVNRLHKVLKDAGQTRDRGVRCDRRLGPADARSARCGNDGSRGPRGPRENAAADKRPELRKALDCRFREHHAFLVSQILAHVDYLKEAIAGVSAQLDKALVPFQAAITVLVSIPGIQHRTTEVMLAKISSDMSRFPTSRHLASWAGLCPGNNKSARKRKRGRTTNATRPNGYPRAKYWRVRGRRGHNRAVIAVAHQKLEIIHQLLTTGELYTDLGAEFFERRQAEQLTHRAIRQLERLAHQVTLTQPATAQPAADPSPFSEQQEGDAHVPGKHA